MPKKGHENLIGSGNIKSDPILDKIAQNYGWENYAEAVRNIPKGKKNIVPKSSLQKQQEKDLVPVRNAPKGKEQEAPLKDPKDLPDDWHDKHNRDIRRWQVNKMLSNRINKFIAKCLKP